MIMRKRRRRGRRRRKRRRKRKRGRRERKEERKREELKVRQSRERDGEEGVTVWLNVVCMYIKERINEERKRKFKFFKIQKPNPKY